MDFSKTLIRFLFSFLILVALALTACGGGSTALTAPPPQPPAPPPPSTAPAGATYVPNGSWTLVWSDEFNGADGSLPDATKWVVESGPALYNEELEYYTDKAANAHMQGGNLVITANAESYGGRSSHRRVSIPLASWSRLTAVSKHA